jgi:predicted HicB family RNase H-like nuclease
MEYKGYSARVEFDSEAGLLFGEVEGLRDVVTFEATNVADLDAAFHESVDDYLAMCKERGEEPEKPYSGKFLLRVDPKLHREVAIAAARAGKSLNAFASDLFRTWIDGNNLRRQRSSTAESTSAVSEQSKDVGVYPTSTPPVEVPSAGPVAEARPWGTRLTRKTPGAVASDTQPGQATQPGSRTPQTDTSALEDAA